MSLYRQQTAIPILKAERTILKQINSQILQNLTVCIDVAFLFFFRTRKTKKDLATLVLKAKADMKVLHSRYWAFALPIRTMSISIKTTREY